MRRNHPGHDVERERPLLALEVESDALIKEGSGQGVGSQAQFLTGRRWSVLCTA
jgi:hypothetical protein